jgi:hypothetical protein
VSHTPKWWWIPTRAIYILVGYKPSTWAACFMLSFVKSCWPLLRDLSCSQDQDHVHATYMCCFYTGSMQKHAFHPPQKCLTPILTGGEHKNILDRFIRQINALSSCEYLSWKVLLQKRYMVLCKRKNKKKKEKKLKK